MNNKKIKSLHCFWIVFLIFFITLGLMPAVSYSQEKVIRVGLASEPWSLDNHVGIGGDAQFIVQAITESLLTRDREFNLVPQLAKSWDLIGDTTWRFYLREGITFHSGNPFNAQAVKAHFDRLINPQDPGSVAGWANMLREVQVVNDYTVDFLLSSVHSPFSGILATKEFAITDIKELERLGEDKYGMQVSGTGPFQIKEWRTGEYIILQANPNYWKDGKPIIDRLEFYFIPEASARIFALELGEVDIILGIAGEEIPRLQTLRNINVFSAVTMRSVFWHMNMRHPLLSDRSIRRALVHAIDNSLIIEMILGASGIPLSGYFPSGVFGSLDMPYNYNPDLSVRILEKNGWKINHRGIFEKDGQELSLTITTAGRFARDIEVAEAIQMELQKMGINLSIRRLEWASLRAIIGKAIADIGTSNVPDFDLITWGPAIGTGDVGLTLSSNFSTFGAFNSMHYSVEEVDKLVEIALSMPTDESRLQVYHEIQRLLYADVASIPLWTPSFLGAANIRVKNFELHPLELFFWELLDIE